MSKINYNLMNNEQLIKLIVDNLHNINYENLYKILLLLSTIKLIPTQYAGKKKYGDFKWMIDRKEYDDALFIFNDNYEAFVSNSKKAGGGNAVIRPYKYKNLPRAAGIPTGHWDGKSKKGIGFSVLDIETKKIIDESLNVIKNLLDTGRYSRVFYSGKKDGTLGTKIFVVGDDVKDYIVSALQKLVFSY